MMQDTSPTRSEFQDSGANISEPVRNATYLLSEMPQRNICGPNESACGETQRRTI